MKNNIITSVILAIMIAFSFASCNKERVSSSSRKVDYEYRFKSQNGSYTRAIGWSSIEIREVGSNQQEQNYICDIHIESKDGKWISLFVTGSIYEIEDRANSMIDSFVKFNTESRRDVDEKTYLQFKNTGFGLNIFNLQTNLLANETIKFNDISQLKNYIPKMIEELI